MIEGGAGCLTGKHCDLTRGITTSPGSSTVTFHLSKPDSDFLFQLALPDYDAVPASTPLHAQLPLPATGPYKIAGYQPKGVVVLVRNPRFRVWSAAAQPDGYPDRIVERYRYTGPSAIRAVQRGTVDITAYGLDQTWPPKLAASLQTRYSSQLYPAPTLYHFGLWLNTRLAPFNDVRVRHAFNLAVDRDRLVQISGGTIGGGGMPVPAAQRERLQLLLPLQRAEPREGPPARHRVRHQGAAGHDLDVRPCGRAPVRRLPRLGPAKHRLQGSGRVRSA